MSDVKKLDWKTITKLPEKIGWRDQVIALLLAAVYVSWLLATARSLGFARDEGFYFRASAEYARWFNLLFDKPGQAIERPVVDASWASNHEHPALMKSLFALSWHFLHEKWHVFSDASTAFRFPGMVMMGVAIYVTYLFGARAFSRRAGAMGAVLLGLAPNMFYNAHLACFDVPIMAMWLVCIYVYWRAEVKGGLKWAIACGIVYGLTLDTKHNAWMLPGVFLPHALFTHWKKSSDQIKNGTVPVPASLVSMALIGPIVFVLLWPWLWNDTLPRLQEWWNFHMHHEYYNIEFLGKNYWGPPSPKAYAPVMIFATVPTVTVLLFVIGAQDRLRILLRRAQRYVWRTFGRPDPKGFAPKEDKAETDILLFLAFGIPLAVFFLPSTPIFGGTKHWFPAYPFMAIFAGRGFDMVANAFTRVTKYSLTGVKRSVADALLAACVVIGPLAITSHSHPFGLSTYVPFVGGTAGGADLGLNRQFWGFTTESLAPTSRRTRPRTRRCSFTTLRGTHGRASSTKAACGKISAAWERRARPSSRSSTTSSTWRRSTTTYG
jgi:4-amino-4-deoxy-L-arabinose transferase-like glycosyltransferase